MSGHSPTYEPKHSLGYATKVGAQAAGVGAFVSAVQNALARHGQGATGILTRTGGTIGFFGMSLPPVYCVPLVNVFIQLGWAQPLP
jgi:hypothetical protein